MASVAPTSVRGSVHCAFVPTAVGDLGLRHSLVAASRWSQRVLRCFRDSRATTSQRSTALRQRNAFSLAISIDRSLAKRMILRDDCAQSRMMQANHVQDARAAVDRCPADLIILEQLFLFVGRRNVIAQRGGIAIRPGSRSCGRAQIARHQNQRVVAFLAVARQNIARELLRIPAVRRFVLISAGDPVGCHDQRIAWEHR